eukprot:Sro523_g159850.1 n/a (168) ;mRNA; r:53782-54534
MDEDPSLRKAVEGGRKPEERALCRQLFDRLTDPSNRTDVERSSGTFWLVGLMDQMNIPANNNVTNRLYSMTIAQAGDFDNLYDNDGDFRDLIQWLQEKGGPFSGVDGGGGGNGGNDGGGLVACIALDNLACSMPAIHFSCHWEICSGQTDHSSFGRHCYILGCCFAV